MAERSMSRAFLADVAECKITCRHLKNDDDGILV